MSITEQDVSAGVGPRPPEARMDAGPVGDAEAVRAHQVDPLITVSFNSLMALAKRLIAEQLDDCDEEFLAGRAHGIGSLHSEILGLARQSIHRQVQDAPKTAGAPEPCRSSENAQAADTDCDALIVDGVCSHCGMGPCIQQNEAEAQVRGAGLAAESPRSGSDDAPQSTQSEASDAPGQQGSEAGAAAHQLSPHPLSSHRVSAELAEEVLATILWLYRRLPRGYGRPPMVERPILDLAKHTGIDITDCLAERGPGPQAKTENN